MSGGIVLLDLAPDGTWTVTRDGADGLRLSFAVAGVSLTPTAAGWLQRGVWPRACACGARFTPAVPWQAYCGPRCRQRAQQAASRARQAGR